MGQASGTHDPGSADLFVFLVAIALEDTPVTGEELGGPSRAGPGGYGLGLLPLHADGGLVSLDVSAFEQIALQDGGQREQQLAPRR
jgi:hypothetical protein